MICNQFRLFVAFCLLATPCVVTGQDGSGGQVNVPAEESAVADRGAETALIEAAVASYVAAFNGRDAEKLVEHWHPEGVYISSTSGDRIVGHEAMTEEFSAILKAEDAPTLAVTTSSIEFISPSVALERGSATITRGESTEETDYRVVYVKLDGKWLIDRVTEEEVVVFPSNYGKLKELEWLVGEWVDDGGDYSIELECRWTRNQNYLSRTYRVETADGVGSTGLQIIGWDAKEQQVRSWLFDSDGGFIKGTWNQSGDRWVVQSVATLPDGASGSFTSVFTPSGDGTYRWKKINRVLDGKLLPNVDEVIVRRK